MLATTGLTWWHLMRKKVEILFIEVIITDHNILETLKLKKCRKYDNLTKEHRGINKMPMRVLHYVLSWVGIVTKIHKKYRRELGISRNIHCYIQSLILKETFENIYIGIRRYQGNRIKREQELDLGVENLYADCGEVKKRRNR